jgi:hypothetical protein
MTELGRFQADINTWRRALAATSGDNLYNVFCNAAGDFGAFVNGGLDRQTAVDMLMQMNEAYGIVDDPDEVEQLIAEAFERAPKPAQAPQPKTNGHAQQARPAQQKAPPQQHVLRPYHFPDPATLPPRQWLYATHYIRGFCVATVAPGGFGKTTLALNEALQMAEAGLRVWFISGEDDLSEIERRVGAHCKYHSRTPDMFGNRLFLDDKSTFPLKIAESSRNGPKLDLKRLEEFERCIIENAIDVVILDPFVAFHFLAENDTTAMTTLITTLANIASRRNACIELAHHVRKPATGQVELTVYDARGAAAIVNAVRSCRVLNQMSLVEAQQLQKPPEKRSQYFRVDSGKRNMAPPEKARWMHLVSVQIGNGDYVQALEPFAYEPEKTSEADEAWVVGILSGGIDYRADSRSPEWLGVKIAEHFDRSVNVKGDILWINRQLRKWLTPDPPRRKKALIRKIVKLDDNHMERMFFELTDKAVP